MDLDSQKPLTDTDIPGTTMTRAMTFQAPGSSRVSAMVLVALLSLLAACGRQPADLSKESKRPGEGEGTKAADSGTAAQRRQLVENCQRNRPRIQTLTKELRRAERDLAAVRNESYRPAARPKKAFDEATESRFRPEDQDLDQQRYEAAVAAWERAEADRQRQWNAAHRQRVEQAQAELNSTARKLRELEPDLFTGPRSIEFVPVVAQRVNRCDARELISAQQTR